MPNAFFWLFLGLFCLIFIIFLIKIKTDLCVFFLSTGVFIGGALSNAFDRAFFGCVFDYIVFFRELLPVFNIADIGIFIGSFIMFLTLLNKNFNKKWIIC